jgi:hypothetical protein
MLSSVSRLAVASAALLIGASSAFAHQELPTKGTCGFLASMHYPFAYQYGSNAGPGWGLNVLATFDFDTKTFIGNVVLIDPNGPDSRQRQQLVKAPFTVSAGKNPGFFNISASFEVDNQPHTFTWHVVPVNGGRTLLMQQGPGQPHDADGGQAGVCQF